MAIFVKLSSIKCSLHKNLASFVKYDSLKNMSTYYVSTNNQLFEWILLKWYILLRAPTFVVTPAVLDKEREFVKGIEIRRVYLKGKQMIVKLGWSKIPKIGEISSVFGL